MFFNPPRQITMTLKIVTRFIRVFVR